MKFLYEDPAVCADMIWSALADEEWSKANDSCQSALANRRTYEEKTSCAAFQIHLN